MDRKSIEALLRDYKVLKAISMNDSMVKENRDIALNKVNNIELALSALEPAELEIINLKYFNNIKTKDIAIKLDVTEQNVSTKITKILHKINRVISL